MERIKRFAKYVFKQLGAGFNERVYHNAIEVLLKKHSVMFETERVMPVLFEGVEVGTVRADLVIENRIVIELKRGSSLRDKHTTQCFMYMKLLGITEGLVINFPVNDEDEVEFQEICSSPICTRCGRDSHMANACYAKTHVDGYAL
jgi:GxxExxY protein